MYSGITDISTFQYIIIALDINQTIITVTPQLSEFNEVSINATIELELSLGRYQFIVISSNIYGKSEQSRNFSVIMVVNSYHKQNKHVNTVLVVLIKISRNATSWSSNDFSWSEPQFH